MTKPHSLRNLVVPALVLVLGLMLTGLGAYAVVVEDRRTRAADLSHSGDLIAQIIQETMELGVTQVRSAQALFEASNEVSAVEFSRFSLYQGSSPGMVAIGFARIVKPGEWQEFTSDAQAERSQYVVVDTNRHAVRQPPPDRDTVPVWFIHMRGIMPAMLGLDLAEDPLRREAIERALTTRRPSITGLVEVLDDSEDAYVEIYSPVHSSSGGGPGVVFARINLFDLISSGTQEALGSIVIGITDVTETGAREPASRADHWSTNIPVEDRTWEISLRSGEGAEASPLLTSALIGGVAISLLAAVLTSMAVTARKRRREIDDLIASTREKDVFLASVAHELRTPLTSVVGITAVLSEQWRDLGTSEIEDLLGATHSEASDLADLIEDFLVAGRLDAGAIHYRPETVDVSLEIRHVLDRVSRGLDVELELPQEDLLSHADPLRVRQIVRNLVVNAHRYARSSVRISARRPGDRLVIEFSNDGKPIPSHIEEVLFEPYQKGRDRPIVKGSIGLGLPVSRRLARAMGGDLTYRYDRGRYEEGRCVFTMELPGAGAPPEREDIVTSAAETAEPGRR